MPRLPATDRYHLKYSSCCCFNQFLHILVHVLRSRGYRGWYGLLNYSLTCRPRCLVEALMYRVFQTNKNSEMPGCRLSAEPDVDERNSSVFVYKMLVCYLRFVWCVALFTVVWLWLIVTVKMPPHICGAMAAL